MKPYAYYNEHDPFAARWLENLILEGVIAYGEVDRRSIVDVRPRDLVGYTQCHFFAGIGGWSLALRMAGWPDDRPAWTGSCPCQPFSAAGKGGGFADERHLWPSWFHLVRELHPEIIFGEQVASPPALEWFDLVQADMESQAYACASADLCAASVGAPHIRQRLYWLAESSDQRREGKQLHLQPGQPQLDLAEAGRGGTARELADSGSTDAQRSARQGAGPREEKSARPTSESERSSNSGVLVDANGGHSSAAWLQRSRQHGQLAENGVTGFWHPAEWVPCRDGKARPVEFGTFPLAYGIPNRVGRLRAYGNAIVPQVAAEFVGAYLET